MLSPELITYVLKNLWHKKSRSFLTILSIFVGISTIFIFISFGWGLYDFTNSFTTSGSVDKLIVQAKGIGMPGLDSTFQLTDKDLKTIEKVNGIAEVSGAYFKVAQVKKDNKQIYTFLIAYDPQKPLILDVSNLKLLKGRMLQKNDDNKVLLGYNYQVPGKIFDKALDLNDKVEVQGQDLRVIGFLDTVGSPPDDAQIYITNDYLTKLYPGNNSYGYIVVKVNNINQIPRIITEIENKLRKSRGLEKGKEDFYVQSFDDMIATYTSVLNILVGFIILIALISVLVSAINTANTMVTSVLERTKEIGIMKSIGATNSEIFNIFLFESSALGFIAGCFGVIVGYIFTSITAGILKTLGWGFLNPHYSWTLFLGLTAFATITGAISGALPAYRASKTNIVDALRYE